MDANEFHKIVRSVVRRTELGGITRKADIAYEYTDGTVAYDDIEDPLPYNMEADNIVIDDNDYAIFYRDIMEDPMPYNGKTVTLKMRAARNPKFPKNEFALGRNVMTCCVEDIQFCWFVAEVENEADVREKGWDIVRAEINVQKHKFYRGKGPVLHIKEIVSSAPPEKDVATFN